MEREDGKIYSVWIDWKRHIISFEAVEGFERLDYATHKEMFDFVIEKGFAGFSIQ